MQEKATIRMEERTTGKEVPEGTKKTAGYHVAQKPAPGAPLPNPLPVPKKVKKNKIDFDHQVDEKDMKFDIDVPDGDDFDI